MPNRLVVIGWLSNKTCYLNVDRETAIRRYEVDNDDHIGETPIEEFEFNDEFYAYDVSPR